MPGAGMLPRRMTIDELIAKWQAERKRCAAVCERQSGAGDDYSLAFEQAALIAQFLKDLKSLAQAAQV